MSSQDKSHAGNPQGGSDVQGEGNYDATRRYDRDTEKFLEKANVEDLARKAAPKSPAEADEMKKAEEAGLAHRATSKDTPGKA
jgi:hypothetical protein